MTAQAVSAPSAIPASTKAAPAVAAKAATAAFEQQLHQARRHTSPARPDREPGASRAHHGDNASREAGSSHADHATKRPGKDAGEAAGKGKPATGPVTKSHTSAGAPAPAQAEEATTPTVAEAGSSATSGAAAAGKKDAEGNDDSAPSLVGAMLALINPAAVKMLTPDAAVATGRTGDPAGATPAAAFLLQGTDATTAAVSADVASTAMSAQLLAEGLSADQKKGRDGVRIDAAPALGLSALTAAPAAPVSVPISAPAGSHAFAQELGQQVAWFVGQDVKQARIRLHPEELGSIDLKISVHHGRVDVAFQAQHPGAVTAVQQSLPQLDQMLAQHGLSLGNTEVGQHDRGNQSARGGQGDSLSETDEIHAPGLVTPLRQLGLLDAFA